MYEKQLFAVKHLIERYSLSRSTILRLAQSGQFPKPIKLSNGCIRWRWSDIQAWERSVEEVKND